MTPSPRDDEIAVLLRGFGPLGLLAMVVIVLGDVIVKPLSAILVLLWAHRSHTPWREIGYVRPRSWIGGFSLGIVLGVAFKFVMKAVVMPFVVADPINHAYHYLVGNRAALPGMLFMLIIGAGFGEETVFRGYLFERFGKLFGTGTGAKAAIVLLTSTLFALGHYSNEGLAGVEQAAMTGLVFGTIFAFIYWDLEADVAHLVFK